MNGYGLLEKLFKNEILICKPSGKSTRILLYLLGHKHKHTPYQPPSTGVQVALNLLQVWPIYLTDGCCEED